MFLAFLHTILNFFTTTVTAVGVGTLAAMGLTWMVAGRQRRHSAELTDSKDRRETAYQSLRHAIDQFTRQTDTDSPMRLRSDWAILAHALEAARALARNISSAGQLDIWNTQLEYFRRVSFSALRTQEAFLEALADNPSPLARFNHRPAERHVSAVVRWVLQSEGAAGTLPETLSDAELARLEEVGLGHLAAEIRRWREPVTP
jgi:hypothetical protein